MISRQPLNLSSRSSWLKAFVSSFRSSDEGTRSQGAHWAASAPDRWTENSPLPFMNTVPLGEPNPFPATFSPQFVDGTATSASPQLADVSRVLRLSVCLRVRPGGPDVRAGGGHWRPFLPVSGPIR
jgi:hypothetical protein